NDDGYNPVQNQVGNNSSTDHPVKWRYLFTEIYNDDPITLSFTQRGFSAGDYGPLYLACSSGCPTSNPSHQTLDGDYLPGQWYYDLAFTYKFAHKDSAGVDAEAFLNIQNVTNEQAKPVGSTNYWFMSTNPFLYDTLGRIFRAGVRFKM